MLGEGAGGEPLRLVVLGDSLSAGVGDPDPRLPLLSGVLGRLQGWPHHLQQEARAAGRQVSVRVLARNGARTARVRAEQLDVATALLPDVATCFTGVNDVFAPGFDVDAFRVEYSAVVHGLVEASRCGVVTLALHDVTAALPLSDRSRERLRANVAAADAVVAEVSAEAGAWLIGADRLAADLRGEGLLSLDRLHPNRAGHRRVAAEVARVLHQQGLLPEAPPEPLASVEPDGSLQRWLAHASHALWLARFAPGPVLRGRSLPEVLRR